MEDSKPTCFVSFEMPLTVTFTVETGSGETDWSDSGEEQDDSEHRHATSRLTDAGIFTNRPKSLSVSAISDKMRHINFFSTTDDYIGWENGDEFAKDQIIVCESSDYKRGMMERVDVPCLYKSVEHLSDEIEGEDVVFYSSQNDSFENHFCIDTDDYDCNHVDDFLRVDSLESCLRRHDLVPESRAEEEKEASLSDSSSDNLDVCLSMNVKNDFPSADDCDDFVQEVAVAVLGDGISSITCTALPKGSRARDFLENGDSFLSQFFCCSDGDILPLKEQSDTAGHGNDDLKLKNEKVPMDLGYFTEEGNEGGKDEEECNNSLRGTSGSGGLSDAKTSPNDNCCCRDEIQAHHNAKSQLGRSKSSTLEHSRTGLSFDFSASSVSPKDNNSTWTDQCRFFPNSVPAKSATFLDYPVPFHKWHYFVDDSDSSQAMEKLKAVANHLCLPVNRIAKKEGFTENCSQPTTATNQRKKASVSVNIDSWETNDHHTYPAMTYDSINEFIAQMKHELFQLRKADDAIAARMLFLYGEIKQYKYVHNCHLYREMMEAAIDNEDKKDELSCHHVDTIPERLCATFKHWGLTRINLQRRRFSIF